MNEHYDPATDRYRFVASHDHGIIYFWAKDFVDAEMIVESIKCSLELDGQVIETGSVQ